MAALYAGPALGATDLKKEVADLVDQATYEVVVPKPDDNAGGITYAKPLPWQSVSYARRTDDYRPLGTAFAIGPNTFVTASHVMQLPGPTQWDERFLRDQADNLYEIDTVSKAAVRPDFVVFSLKNPPDRPHFSVNQDPTKNERVFAVGNALGQGIVIREGRYTSRTPEEYKGNWEWLRFSAAASPGNSGGPLLDKEGRVLGVVTRKSENENLNYALPISVALDAPEGEARMRLRAGYKIENMQQAHWDKYDIRVDLPRPLDELRRKMAKKELAQSVEIGDAFFRKYEDDIFPRAKGSENILHDNDDVIFPHMMWQGGDGTWGLYSPEDRKTTELPNNGSITWGRMGRSVFMLVNKPDDLGMERFTHDSKKFMDLLLEAIPAQRHVGSEKVTITSLGEADRELVHTDSYGRKWQGRVWSIPYEDSQVLTFSMPVPGGSVVFLKNPQTRSTDGLIYDMKKLTDFVFLSHYGTLEQWREYLALDSLLPQAYSDIEIDFTYGERFHYESDRLALTYGPDQMRLQEDSDLQISFSYFREDGEVIWDDGGIMVGAQKDTNTFFKVKRNSRPDPSLADDVQEEWAKLSQGRYPYNGDPHFTDGRTVSGTLLEQGLEPPERKDADHLYTVFHVDEGEVEETRVKERLRRFRESLEVKEEPSRE